MNEIIVALIGLIGTFVGVLAGLYGRSRKNAIMEAKREQEQSDLFKQIFSEMNEIKKRLDLHNSYAEKFSEFKEAIASIKKDIEYIRKENNG